MFSNISVVPMEQDHQKVIPLTVVEGKLKKKETKYNKDGSIDRRSNNGHNKVVGKDSEVYAFRTKEEIAAMLEVFDKHIEEAANDNQRQIACRNKLLFLIGMNVGIRASDLRTLKWCFFFDKNNDVLEFKNFYTLQPMKQRKQKKFVKLFFNQTVKTVINSYISEYPIDDLNDYLFASRKGDEPIKVNRLWEIIKNTAIEAGIKQNIGSHSLRKTFGFWVWHEAEDKNKALVVLQQCFNHSSTQVTMKYIGLMDDEIEDMYNSIELGLDFL
jgi:integrase